MHRNESDPNIEEERSLSSALCVCFDSESLGFAGALTKVFTRVSALSWMYVIALDLCYYTLYYCTLLIRIVFLS